jgi:hypothetical protein
MPGSCCANPVTKIIDIDGIETGIMGLDTIISNAYLFDIKDEAELKEQLLKWTKEFGNYVTEGRENAYKDALFREYKIYSDKKIKEKEEIWLKQRVSEKTETKKPKKYRWFKFFK